MADEVRDTPSRDIRRDRRREVAETRRDTRRQRLAVALIGVFLLVIAGILLAGYVVRFVLPSREVVVKVDTVEYTRGDMVKILRISQKGSELLGQTSDATDDIFATLQRLVENEMIAQTAPTFGITVSEEEVDAEVRTLLSTTGDAAAGKDAAQLEREFRERYTSYLNTLQVSKSEYRRIVRHRLLRDKFRQFIGDSVPTVGEQVHLHRLVIGSQGEIDVMLTKYEDSTADSTDSTAFQRTFGEAVREFSQDIPDIIRTGGDLGWVPQRIFEEYDYAFFELEIGQMSEPTPNNDNPSEIFFFMVSERSQARGMAPAYLNTLKERALQDWLNEERDNHDVFAAFDSEIYAWMLDQLRLTAQTTPTPPPGPVGF